ncbi:MAG: 4Fe-4S binding protein [Desulfobacteraceae bacterium]
MKLEALHENCSGCRTCLVVCALENCREINPSKSVLRIQGLFPGPGTYRIHLCDQCGACAEVCPEDAIRNENGVYKVDPDKCTGCMLCVAECPHDVMCSHPDFPAPFKCTLCGACVDACPRGAIRLVEETGLAAGNAK